VKLFTIIAKQSGHSFIFHIYCIMVIDLFIIMRNKLEYDHFFIFHDSYITFWLLIYIYIYIHHEIQLYKNTLLFRHVSSISKLLQRLVPL
jgi:hypothetical protein